MNSFIHEILVTHLHLSLSHLMRYPLLQAQPVPNKTSEEGIDESFTHKLSLLGRHTSKPVIVILAILVVYSIDVSINGGRRHATMLWGPLSPPKALSFASL